jgi:hypothetical protein
MTDTLIPALVDVWPKPGRRVRDQDGAILPEKHVLRGVARSAYWLRLERDGDVELKAHEPETEIAVEAVPTVAPSPAAGDAAPLPADASRGSSPGGKPKP